MSLIYIVEDDPSIREIESIALRNSGYNVSAFERGKDFHRQIEVLLPDLVILDIMLPDENGYEILRRLRKEPATRSIPVIMVTAKTTEFDLVKGFETGADDYLRKPFSVMELLSRVKALLRRTVSQENDVLQIGGILLDHQKHLVTADGQAVELTFKEYELLRYLMLNHDIVLSRETLMNAVWGIDYAGETRTVDMHIKTLRQKLSPCGSQIGTIRNVGYVLRKEWEKGHEAEH